MTAARLPLRGDGGPEAPPARRSSRPQPAAPEVTSCPDDDGELTHASGASGFRIDQRSPTAGLRTTEAIALEVGCHEVGPSCPCQADELARDQTTLWTCQQPMRDWLLPSGGPTSCCTRSAAWAAREGTHRCPSPRCTPPWRPARPSTSLGTRPGSAPFAAPCRTWLLADSLVTSLAACGRPSHASLPGWTATRAPDARGACGAGRATRGLAGLAGAEPASGGEESTRGCSTSPSRSASDPDGPAAPSRWPGFFSHDGAPADATERDDETTSREAPRRRQVPRDSRRPALVARPGPGFVLQGIMYDPTNDVPKPTPAARTRNRGRLVLPGDFRVRPARRLGRPPGVAVGGRATAGPRVVAGPGCRLRPATVSRARAGARRGAPAGLSGRPMS